MGRHRLFCPTLAAGTVVLPPEESHHAIASLRAKQGEQVMLFDGAGREAVGLITKIDGRQVCVDVSQITERPFELRYHITLAVAMGRMHRQAYLVEKCTELGVAAIWPIITRRSVRKPAGKAVDRWMRRAIEAAKQSGRAWVPRIEALQPFEETVRRVDEFQASTMTHTGSSRTSFHTFLSAQPASSSLLVWVGPEGGWSEDECEQARQAGVTMTTLGPTVLRTETAAVAVCAAVALGSVATTEYSKSV